MSLFELPKNLLRSENRSDQSKVLTKRPRIQHYLRRRKIVVILGPTGAGKSSLIKKLSGDQSIVVGNSLNSETSAIKCYNLSYGGHEFALVDTPGFDDSHRSNLEVVEQILEWLAVQHRGNAEFVGVIYVHNIMNPRMQGSALQNLRMFRKLVGSNNMSKVILATSFWDLVNRRKGIEREEALTKSPDFFAAMIGKGAQYMRLEHHSTNLNALASMAKSGSIVLQCQKEMTVEKKSAKETSAAQITASDLAKIAEQKKKHDKEIKAIKQRAERDEKEQKSARDIEKKRMKDSLAKQAQEVEERRIDAERRYDREMRRQQRERDAETARLRQIQQEQVWQQQDQQRRQDALQDRLRQERDYQTQLELYSSWSPPRPHRGYNDYPSSSYDDDDRCDRCGGPCN